MKKILKYFSTFIEKKGHILALFTFLLFVPNIAFAAEPTTSEAMTEAVMTGVSLMIQVLNMLLWPLLLIIGELMSNDLIIGPGMEERLLAIWQQIRDLVNIAFVLILLIMAFYNVSGMAKEGNFALKTGLPKLVIGLILVNFTFLGGKVLLDVSNIATNLVFALPQSLESATSDDSTLSQTNFKATVTDLELNMCTKPAAVGSTERLPYTKDDKTIPPVTSMFCTDEAGELSATLNPSLKAKFFGKLNVSNVGMIMAVNMGHLADLNYTDVKVTNISDLAINTVFSLIMFVIFAISYIVLAIVLIARVAVLWLAMAFSPVAVLFYVVPELKSSAGEGGDIAGKVLTHVMAPIKLGIVLTVGFIMIDAMFGATGASSSSLITSAKIGTFGQTLLLTGIADLQRLLIAMTTIVVLWKGVFFAVSGTEAQFLVDKVKGFADQAGDAAMGALKYAPLTPVQVGKGKDGSDIQGISFGAMSGVWDKSMRGIQQMQEAKTDSLFKSTGLEDFFGGVNASIEKLGKDITGGMSKSDYASKIKEAYEQGKGFSNSSPDGKQQYIDAVKALIQKNYTGTSIDTKLKELEKAKGNATTFADFQDIVLKDSGVKKDDRDVIRDLMLNGSSTSKPATGSAGGGASKPAKTSSTSTTNNSSSTATSSSSASGTTSTTPTPAPTSSTAPLPGTVTPSSTTPTSPKTAPTTGAQPAPVQAPAPNPPPATTQPAGGTPPAPTTPPSTPPPAGTPPATGPGG